MLASADQELAARDPALPGLPLLLDAEALGAWLSQRLETRVQVHTRYLRYKPATSCVLAALIVVPGGQRHCVVAAYSERSADKLAKTLERAPTGSVLGMDAVSKVIATTIAADRDLPALTRLDDDSRSLRLLRRLLGDRHGLRDASLTTLRHKPCRRWVGLLEPPGGPRAVIRVYRPGVVEAATGSVFALHGTEPWTPRLLGADVARGVAALEFLAGRTLDEHGRDPGARSGLAEFAAAGSALARLHARRGVPLRPGAATAEAARVCAAARFVSVLLPDLADDLHWFAQHASARLLSWDDLRRPIHGDFSPEQVVVADDGRIGLIDLDSACLGDPSVDLASASSRMTRDVVLDEACGHGHRQRLRALYDGYAAVGAMPDEDRLATHEAAYLLRRAVEPFRLRLTPHWPDAIRGLVERARQTLPTASLSGGARWGS